MKKLKQILAIVMVVMMALAYMPHMPGVVGTADAAGNHAHEFTYTADQGNGKITAKCGKFAEEGCILKDTSGEVSLSMTMENSEIPYTGKSVEAVEVTDEYDWNTLYEGITKYRDVVYEGINGTTYAKSTTAPKEIGEYRATLSLEGEVYAVFKEFKIVKALVPVPEAIPDLVYNGEVQSGVKGDAKYTLRNHTAKDVGSYTAVATLSDTTHYRWANYDDTPERKVNWGIGQKTVAVKADNKTALKGAKQEALTYTYDEKDVYAGDKFTGELAVKNFNKDIEGTYEIEQNTLSLGDNYIIDFTEGKYTVKEKFDQTLKFEKEDGKDGKPAFTKTYGDKNFTNVAKGAVTAVTYTSTSPNVAAVNSKTGEVTIKGAGETTITATAAEDETHSAATATYTVKVEKVSVPVPSAKSYIYNGNVQIGIEADSEVYEVDGNAAARNVGSYNVQVSLKDTVNYEWNDKSVAKKDLTWSIQACPIVVKADDKTTATGKDLAELTYSVIIGELCGSDFIQGKLKTDASKEKVGSFAIEQKEGSELEVVDGNNGSNYVLTFIQGIYKVVDKEIRTVEFAEKSVAKTFGDAKFTNAATVTPAAAVTYASSDKKVATVDAATGEVTIVGAGEATITASVPEDEKYAAEEASYILTVGKAKVGVPTAGVDLTYTGKEIEAVRGADADAGKYTLTGNKERNAGAYTAKAVLTDKVNTEWADGTADDKEIVFAIAAKKINVEADNVVSYVGDPLKELTHNGDAQLCEGDSFTGALETTADKDVKGEYPITQGTLAISDGNAGNNYELTFKEAKYIVTDVVYCNVKFDVQGHGVAPAQAVVKEGTLLDEPAAPEADGYRFAGWFKNPECTQVWNFATDLVKDLELTLYAKWDAAYSLDDCSISLDKKSFVFNDKVLKPEVTVYDEEDFILSEGVDYTVKYSNAKSKAVGRYTVKVTGIGAYAGTFKAKYTINPAAVKIKEVRAGVKKLGVIWAKPAKAERKQITGYEVVYSTKKNFSGKKTVKVKDNNAKYTYLTKLGSKKGYYVKMRAYKKVDGATYYSAWSNIKGKYTK